MREWIKKQLDGKTVAILGFGMEGRSTYRFLRSCFPDTVLHILDLREDLGNDDELMADHALNFHLGSSMMEFINTYDIIVKAPGVSGKVLPSELDRRRITSQTDLFLQFFGQQVIGVTGTKGKSTTASLIHHILEYSGVPSVLVGNIGLPAFDGIKDITPQTRIVMELSSHQLEYLNKSPHISVLLNIFQEHLDHYHSYEEYQQAKLNIARFQDKGDYLLFPSDHELIKGLIMTNPGFLQHLLPYSVAEGTSNCIYRKGSSLRMRNGNEDYLIVSDISGFNLKGDHNFLNLMAASAACYLSGVIPEKISASLNSFTGLEHRIEYVGLYSGIHFYNDSIATIPEATIAALNTLPRVDTLILGGYDRGIDYSILYPFLQNSGISNLIFIGEAGQRMKREMERFGISPKGFFSASSFEEVVAIAMRETLKGAICLLSPAASSYDMFRNFEHRGTIYKQIVREQVTSQS